MNTGVDVSVMDEREALWTQFLDRWPLERLNELTLPQYNQAGEDDHFCRWVEKHTEALGSIWGGSSLKFGIYSLDKSSTKKPSAQKGVQEDGQYGWYAKYGTGAEAAFATVRQLVVQTASAARAGRLDEVEQIDLWPIFRRKIAFLYQDRQSPCLLPIYMGPMLRQGWLGDGEPPKAALALYQGLMAQRGERALLKYYDEVMVRVKAAQAKQIEDRKAELLTHFAAVPDLAQRLEAAGQTNAFFRLALALNDAGLDWWVTGTQAIHAGRTDDPKVWQTVVALVLECTANGVRGRLHAPGDGAADAEWELLDADVVDGFAKEAAADVRVPELSGRKACWPDDYDGSETTLTVLLTDSAVKSGHIKVPKLQALFPKNFIAADEKSPADKFQLILPSGAKTATYVLASRSRLKASFDGLFNQLGVKVGDRAVIQKEGDGLYRLLLNAQGQTPATASSVPSQATSTTTPVRTMSSEPLNQILFGPPGTGKTYSTIDRTLAILDPAFLAKHEGQNTTAARVALKGRFDELKELGRVRFTTFHQSFGYEDFVEGLRAEADPSTGQIKYVVADGVFKTLCEAAAAKETRRAKVSIDITGRRIWKMSLGNTLSGETGVYDECLANGYALLGYGGAINFQGCQSRADVLARFEAAGHKVAEPQNDYAVTAVTTFLTRMKVGDLLVITDGNFKFRAIGEIAGDYQFRQHPQYEDDYSQSRPVRWLRQYEPSLPHTELMNNQFSQMTLYELRPGSIDLEKLRAVLGPVGDADSTQATAPGAPHARVLVIDEINRGNVSRIFGELITLIEPSKRMGAPEALSATLPYSREPFQVPGNVYLIGTMNTADRSLAGLDVALRRRFDFKEMQPRPELLAGVVVGGVSIQALLETLNARIEALLDREHVLGHAYFMPLKDAQTMPVLAAIFRNKVLPLLQEYFFDDWQRIQWVLNDHRKAVEAHRFVQAQSLDMKALFGEDVTVSQQRSGWRINDKAFDLAESYLGVIQVHAAT